MTGADATIFVVDDDPSMREALESLLKSVHLNVRPMDSVSAFLEKALPDAPCCLVLDVRMPGQSGLELQDRLRRAGRAIPIIFITGHADVAMSVRAMKAGAIEFLEKPFREQELLDAIQVALDRDRANRRNDKEIAALREKWALLTPREREIMPLVASGRLNKQIADDLNLSEITVKVHRAQMLRKLGAKSLQELIRIADRLGLTR